MNANRSSGGKMKGQRLFKGLDKSVRKQKIIDTAAALFDEKGYSSTSLDDVSRELGISKAALYHYVKGKDELLSIIYTQAFENIFKDTYEISGMRLAPDEKLRRVIRNHINNIIIKDLSMFSVFFSEESQLPEKDYKKIREEKRRYTSIIEKIIQQGIAEGLFKKADPKLQAYAILGMCNWIYKWYRPDKSLYSPERTADHFISLLETGYLEKGEQEKPLPSSMPQKGQRKSDSGTRVQGLKKLKTQCRNLMKLIDDLEQ